MRKVESIGDASVSRRKSRASVEVGELIGENTSIKKMESGSEHVEEGERGMAAGMGGFVGESASMKKM